MQQYLEQEALIRRYFAMWLQNDGSALGDVFCEDATYSECYGPEYHGLAQIRRWFADWNQRGKVQRWDIRQIVCTPQLAVAEWFFECNYDGETQAFNGVSLITFGAGGKISTLKEFESKARHEYPYGQ